MRFVVLRIQPRLDVRILDRPHFHPFRHNIAFKLYLQMSDRGSAYHHRAWRVSEGVLAKTRRICRPKPDRIHWPKATQCSNGHSTRPIAARNESSRNATRPLHTEAGAVSVLGVEGGNRFEYARLRHLAARLEPETEFFRVEIFHMQTAYRITRNLH